MTTLAEYQGKADALLAEKRSLQSRELAINSEIRKIQNDFWAENGKFKRGDMITDGRKTGQVIDFDFRYFDTDLSRLTPTIVIHLRNSDGKVGLRRSNVYWYENWKKVEE